MHAIPCAARPSRASGASAYVGARGRLDISAVSALSSTRFVVQPKHDGQFVVLHLDSAGRIAAATSRAGLDVPRTLLGDLIGARVGWPGAELVGELTASTEAGNREAATLGHRQVHLFDCLHNGQRPIASEPYKARHAALWAMQTEASVSAGPLPWRPVAGRRARLKGSGRYTAAVPTDYRLTPIVPSLPIARASELWDQVKAGELEGIVVVALGAAAGRRGAKRKVKITDTLDCTVVAVGPRDVTLWWPGGVFAVGRGRHELQVGSVVEVAHNSYFEQSACPRFPRIVRVRDDKIAGDAAVHP